MKSARNLCSGCKRMFDEVKNSANSVKNAFCDNVHDSVGKSLEEELFNVLLDCICSSERISNESDIRETAVKAMLAEARLMI